MNFTLIICTYKRAIPLINLLNSVRAQTFEPNEIIIVDGSHDDDTKNALINQHFKNLHYFKVDAENRGLTKQRNFGISKVDKKSQIICFLDDDTVLETDYFENLMATYDEFPSALGVGGYITNEIFWEKTDRKKAKQNEFVFDGWSRKESSRFIIRKKLHLDTDVPPGISPSFSHGRSVSFFPPSGKTYEVEQLMGGVSSFKTQIFEKHQFSTYFEGYGLYEDADFCIRVAKTGKLYLNTNAKLAHYHDASGRPNMFQYGKMVVRNGWYVWRVKNPNPNFKSKLKWHAITILLMLIRCTNMMNGSAKTQAFHETLGRISGWVSLLFNKPKRSL